LPPVVPKKIWFPNGRLPYSAYLDPYADEAANPRILNSFCAFLDILGFSAKIRHGITSSTILYLKKSLDKSLEDARNPKSSFGHKTLFVKSFTDNTVIASPVIDQDGEGELGAICRYCAIYQFELINAGMLARGGVAFGELYVDENMVIGDALIDAYQQENKISIYPRITISRKILEFIFQYISYYGEPEECSWNEYFLIDGSGVAFIDFVSIIRRWYELDLEEVITPLFEKVIHMYNSSEDDIVAQKTLWLLGYLFFSAKSAGFSSKLKLDDPLLRGQCSAFSAIRPTKAH
jgi:hypothetical protein